jgi:hypothetical protein
MNEDVKKYVKQSPKKYNPPPRAQGKGHVDCYVCEKCGKAHVSKTLDVGVIARGIVCMLTKGCLGAAMALPRESVDQNAEHEFEWVRVSFQKAKKMSKKFPGFMNHWAAGGLAIRRRTR